jgi:hypothetical protein
VDVSAIAVQLAALIAQGQMGGGATAGNPGWALVNVLGYYLNGWGPGSNQLPQISKFPAPTGPTGPTR